MKNMKSNHGTSFYCFSPEKLLGDVENRAQMNCKKNIFIYRAILFLYAEIFKIWAVKVPST